MWAAAMPAIIGAGASLAGDFMASSGQSAANRQNMQIAQMNNAFNAQQAQINRNWETQMSNTQMQRRVEDLKKANLNPALAYVQGGASSPTAGGASSAGNPRMENPRGSFAMLGQQANSAMQLATMQAQIANIQADTKQKIATTPAGVGEPVAALTDWQYKLRSEGQVAFQNIGIAKLEQNKLIVATDNLKAELPKIVAEATSAQTSADYSRSMAEINKQFAIIGNILAEAREPEARAQAQFFKQLGAMGTQGSQGMVKLGIQALMALFEKR